MKLHLLLLLSLLHASFSQRVPVFIDRFPSEGLISAPTFSRKYGGPCIADVDSDGNYDLLLTFHNINYSRIFLGDGNFNFRRLIDSRTKQSFRPDFIDVHGISVAPIHTRSRDRLVTFSVGGGRGTMRRSAEVFRITPDRTVTDITNDLGLGQVVSRPRNAVFMNLALKTRRERQANFGGPDILFTNFLIPPMGSRQFAYGNNQGNFALVRNIGDFANQLRGRVELTDFDNDGVMEVISIRQLRFYKLTDPFQLTEVTSDVLPPNLRVGFLSVSSVVELDFDNDGDYDLYVARAARSLMTALDPLEASEKSDILLRNDGGKYTDVSNQAGIPTRTDSMGVTAEDFNNDGYIDILVVLYDKPDILLLNQGDGTFRRVNGLIPKGKGIIGNHAQAADLDKDGRVDVVVGHGGVEGDDLGPYLFLQNQLKMGANTHYLLVTVYNDPNKTTTSLHAVVKVIMPGGKQMMRRVGSRGGQDGYGSYIDTLHFGLGSVTTVNRIIVTWATGVRRTLRNVQADQEIFVGEKL